MKNLKVLSRECLNEVHCAGIRYGNIASINSNSRLRKTWGSCSRQDDRFAIEISTRLLADDVPDIAVKTTIIHEILHTCAGAFNHGETWKRLAYRMNAAYGYNIKRLTSSSEKGIEEVSTHVETYKYFFKCEKCGQIIRRKRKCDFTRCPSRWRCGVCGNKFIEISKEDVV